jgi:hypothetical protein
MTTSPAGSAVPARATHASSINSEEGFAHISLVERNSFRFFIGSFVSEENRPPRIAAMVSIQDFTELTVG